MLGCCPLFFTLVTVHGALLGGFARLDKSRKSLVIGGHGVLVLVTVARWPLLGAALPAWHASGEPWWNANAISCEARVNHLSKSGFDRWWEHAAVVALLRERICCSTV